MFARRTGSTDTTTETIKGPSLARGPAWIVGSLLAVFGLLMFFEAPGTPLSTAGFPDGAATGDSFLGFEVNAWTAWATVAAGVLVLIGAAQHLAARTMSLIAGLALGAMAIIALIDGDVLGLAAANGWTIVGWAIASGVLLITALLPRLRREREVAVPDRTAGRHRADRTDADARDRDRVVAGDAGASDRVGASDADRGRAATPLATAATDERTAQPAVDHHDAPSNIAYGDGTTPPVTHPAGARSEPLRRTYEGPAQTQAEREAEAEAAAAAARDRRL